MEVSKALQIALFGRSNVGKYTLLNALAQTPLAMTSPSKHSTRVLTDAFLTLDAVQLRVLDPPGLTRFDGVLDQALRKELRRSLLQSDLIWWMEDEKEHLQETVNYLEGLSGKLPPILFVQSRMDERKADCIRIVGGEDFPVATRAQLGLSIKDEASIQALVRRSLPFARAASESLFELNDEITSSPMRKIAAEWIRESVFEKTRAEIPYACGVRVEEYREGGKKTYIAASLILESESQKRLMIGSGGSMIRSIGQCARQKIERSAGSSVFLDLNVKVWKKWRKDPKAVEHLLSGREA